MSNGTAGSADEDGVREAEQIIQDDADLYEAYTRLVNSGWQLSRLAIPTPYRINRDLKTIVLNDQMAFDKILAAIRKAVRQIYLSAPDLRRMAIQARTLTLVARRALLSSTLTDLEIMAQVYDWAAWFQTFDLPDLAFNMPFSASSLRGRDPIVHLSDRLMAASRDMFSDLLTVLSGQRSRGRSEDFKNWGFVSDSTHYVGSKTFNSTGFKREFRDESNQVRHATASIGVCVLWGSFLGKRVAQSREEDSAFADKRLNAACADLAVSFMSEVWLGAKGFGDTIRTELGDPNETSPWPATLKGGIPD